MFTQGLDLDHLEYESGLSTKFCPIRVPPPVASAPFVLGGPRLGTAMPVEQQLREESQPNEMFPNWIRTLNEDVSIKSYRIYTYTRKHMFHDLLVRLDGDDQISAGLKQFLLTASDQAQTCLDCFLSLPVVRSLD